MTSRWQLPLFAFLAAFLSVVATTRPAHAVPCAEPVTFLKICCPKPCPITDPKKFVENTMKQVLEDLKLASTVKEALAWKEQLDQWGKTINSVTNLINSVIGKGSSGISAISPPTLVPNGLNSNPLNISQTAGQMARLFTSPASTISAGNEAATKRSAAISEGFIEGLAVALDGRSKLSTTAEEIKKLTQVVARSQSSDSSSGSGTDKDAENVRSDLASMNQVRLAMLQAFQNQTNLVTAWNSAEGYDAVKTLGPDKIVSRSAWGTEANPSSPYGSLETGIQKAQDSGIGTKDAAISQRVSSSEAFSNYDNLVERAVQAHNAAVSYVAMMKTVALNQETVAHFEISREMADHQRAYVTSGLAIFYANPSDAFGKMATEAVGANGLGGIDPYQWGDSFAQQTAATAAMNSIAQNAVANPAKYGPTICADVPETDSNGHTRYVAVFRERPAAGAPQKLLEIYANQSRLACGALLAAWLSTPSDAVYDQYTPQDTAEAYGPDVNSTRTSDQTAIAAAAQDLQKENADAGVNEAFKYWINLQKRAIWYYDAACGATPAADPADPGACEVYNKQSNPDARAGGAQGTINNLYRSIDNMADALNDPDKTAVLQSEAIKERKALDVTNYDRMRGEIDQLLAAATQARSAVDPAILSEDMYTTRDRDLQTALQAIRRDNAFQTWVNTAAPPETGGQCTTGCWGTADNSWNEPVTVNGFPVPTAQQPPALPVVQHDIDCAHPADSVYCGPIQSAGAPWPIRPQTEFSPTILVQPPYIAN
ncbi:hypothetical protein GCM10019059_39710 [Camelimonas fluminis]|uniref:Uncharacterized protein n=1 Tax=Camelimonas fluminis TaxID=1576911 RepID=A0ABV7UFM0_9HYPH|nr:hypothetical protein [Camelimonas fluminis]GHE76512.1 hypothetical protein GCM10019059_39710 [Camelimonas fluminis]